MFETRDLYYTVTLAECGNISKASQKLFLTQPALTKFIQRHEEMLGRKIFLKAGYNLVLTEYGKCYVEHASRILKELDEMEQCLKALKTSFRIAVGLSAGNYYLPKALPKFYEAYPKIKIDVLQGHSLGFPALVKNGTVDMALCGMCSVDSTMDTMLFKKGEVLLAISKNHPLAKEEGVFKEGFTYPWIDIKLFQEYGFIMCQKDQWPAVAASKIFKEVGLTPNNVLKVSNYQMSVGLAMTTNYATFIDESTIDFTADANNLKYFSVGENPVYYEAFAVYLKESPFIPYIKDFVGILQEIIKESKNSGRLV